jgi:DNA-binding NarL/FixJ family response regulator
VISAAGKHQPHAIVCSILDSALTIVQELRRVAPESAIILWNREFPTELAHQAVDMGVRGFLSTTATPETVRECLRISAGGQMWMERSLSTSLLNVRPVSLSRRQRQLMELLVQGLKNKEIAAALCISEGTVKAYLTTLFDKIGAKDRFELALFGLKNLRNIHTQTAERGTRSSARLRPVIAGRNGRRSVA